jgi:hypothetical protein
VRNEALEAITDEYVLKCREWRQLTDSDKRGTSGLALRRMCEDLWSQMNDIDHQACQTEHMSPEKMFAGYPE